MAKYTKESWILKAIDKYGQGKFSFEKTIYIDSYNKVIVTCLEHNIDFEVDPISFIRESSKGVFCNKCKNNLKITQKEFINTISTKHPNLIFDKTIYTNQRENVVVTCPEHGDFEIKAKNLLHNKYICKQCKDDEHISFDLVTRYTNNEKLGSEDGVFYKVLVTHKPSNIQFIKIGVSSYSTYQRYNKSSYKDFDFDLIEEIIDTNLNTALIEKEYKLINKQNRFFLPKEVDFVGRTECYTINETYQLKSSQIKFIRDSLLLKQNNICPICKSNIKMPTLDHYHSKIQHGSGLIRGVVCNTCNRMIGVIENNISRNGLNYSDAPDILRNLANYLKDNREPYLHPSEAPRKPILMKSCYNKLLKVIDGKQKVPEYKEKRGNLTAPLKKLFEKYGVEPEFKKT